MSNNFVCLRCKDINGNEKETIINLDHVINTEQAYDNAYKIYMRDDRVLIMPNETYNQLVKGIEK